MSYGSSYKFSIQTITLFFKLTNNTQSQEIPDLAGSGLQEDITMRIRWEILSEGVWKSPSEDVHMNLVFPVHCRIKLIDFCPCHLVWLNWSDMIYFYNSHNTYCIVPFFIISMVRIHFETHCFIFLQAMALISKYSSHFVI